MQSAEMTVKEDRAVARPLAVLVPLIKDDLKAGDEAGVIYYKAAGEKLNEAREGSFAEAPVKEFWNWAQRNFNRSKDQLRRYMNLDNVTNELAERRARHGKTFKGFNSLNEMDRQTGRSSSTPSNRVFREYQPPIDDIIHKAQINQARIAQESLGRAEEREAQRKLALQLIDIGYKALASKLHPDKGGTRDAMARLNTVRDRLRTHA